MSIRSCRKRAGLTQQEMAKALSVSGAAVGQWETGETMPKAKLLPAIAKLLGCTIDELFAQEEAVAE